MKNKTLIMLLLIMWISIKVNAQVANELEEIELDLGLGISKNPVPFDKPFIFKGVLPESGRNLRITYKLNSKDSVMYGGFIDSKDDKTFKVLFDYPLAYSRKNGFYNFKCDYVRIITPEQVKSIKQLLGRRIFDFFKSEEAKSNTTTITGAITKGFQRTLKSEITVLLNQNSKDIAITPNSFLDENSNNIQNIFQLGDVFSDFHNLKNDIKSYDVVAFNNLIINFYNKISNKISIYKGGDLHLKVIKDSDGQAIIDLLQNGCEDINSLKSVPLNSCDKLIFDGSMPSKDLIKRANLMANNLQLISKLSEVPLSDEDNKIFDYPDILKLIAGDLDRIDKSIDKILDEIEILAPESIGFSSSISGSMATRLNWYISADVGVLYAYQQKDFVPFIGMNIYFRPIDKNIPFERLRAARKIQGKSSSLIAYRASLVVGLTFGTKNDDPKFNIIFGRGIISGIGYRLTESLKLNAGALWFNQKDINPLVTQYSLKATPYLSLSLDWDLKNFITKFF